MAFISPLVSQLLKLSTGTVKNQRITFLTLRWVAQGRSLELVSLVVYLYIAHIQKVGGSESQSKNRGGGIYVYYC